MVVAGSRMLGMVVLCVSASGCHSAGPYGHALNYVPLDDEVAAVDAAREFDPVMAQRNPAEWNGKPVRLFGVVKARSNAGGGAADVTLSVRTLEPRNLCESHAEDSCRVTVSDREHALVHAQVKLRAEDAIGEHSVGPHSLLRIVGTLRDDVDSHDGTPVLEVSYYRHWPRGFYVTTAARSHMRR